MKKDDISPALASQLEKEGVDLDRMFRFLDDLNAGKYDAPGGIVPETVPSFPHPAIVDRRGPAELSKSRAALESRLFHLGLPLSLLNGAQAVPSESEDLLLLDEALLRKIGIRLYPQTAYGVLNGGSASSYADNKKNRSLDPELFDQFGDLFHTLAEDCRGKPKGITPAFLNPDGSPGWSFLFLKLRMLLEHKKAYKEEIGTLPEVILPSFQMTSVHTDSAIAEALREYVADPGLLSLAESLGCPSVEMYTASQTMMAAITHSSSGRPRKIFDRAWGRADTGIAMPGGHGQNFEVLAPIYRKLRSKGIRFAWLGNIDNMGYTVDPVSLAVFALSGFDAAFEESWRTPMDVKGGILVADSSGKLSCADIGPVISTERMLAFEAEGKPVLFNCGIGLFDLERLDPLLDEIPYRLPLRITDQDKDAGQYAQAEQITWEVIGLLDKPMFLAVEKSRRFLAAKMLMETMLTSLPPSRGSKSELASVSREMHTGLEKLLRNEYGLTEANGKWVFASE